MLGKIFETLSDTNIMILQPMDVFESLDLMQSENISVNCTMLDPWYNKGVGGVVSETEYDNFISKLLQKSSLISDSIYLWGFPEIIGPYVRYVPQNFRLAAWLTWYYKNCPSVVRGWRPSQNACLHFLKDGCKLYPENF